jgi:hypothetical protein
VAQAEGANHPLDHVAAVADEQDERCLGEELEEMREVLGARRLEQGPLARLQGSLNALGDQEVQDRVPQSQPQPRPTSGRKPQRGFHWLRVRRA